MVRLWVARVLTGVVALSGGGMVLAWTATAFEGLTPGWQLLASSVVGPALVALVWTLIADGPRATAALVRVRRERR